jgi:hypothetical protein
VGPQSIWVGLAGFDVDVTLPVPRPTVLAFATVKTNCCRVNVTPTDLGPLIVTVQVEPETASQPPLQACVEPVVGAAVMVTTVPTSYEAEHVGGQLI